MDAGGNAEQGREEKHAPDDPAMPLPDDVVPYRGIGLPLARQDKRLRYAMPQRTADDENENQQRQPDTALPLLPPLLPAAYPISPLSDVQRILSSCYPCNTSDMLYSSD